MPGLPKDCYPAGRLDYDSEGLLLITNDKPLTQLLLHPQYAHPRTYWVQVEGTITIDALAQLQQGVIITPDGKPYRTKPAIAQALPPPTDLPERVPPIRYRKQVPDSWLSLTLTEGKNRQVRRMTAVVGFPTLRLVRYAIGSVAIGGLQPGQHRMLNAAQVLLLRQSANPL